MFKRYALVSLTCLAFVLSNAPAQSNKEFLKSSPQMMAAFSEVNVKPSYSTVRIKCDGKDAALGAIVKPDGWIVTKASELKADAVCIIKGYDKELPAKVVGVNKEYDLAMLKVQASGLSPVDWRSSTEDEVGSWMITTSPSKEPVGVGVLSVAKRSMKKGDWRFPINPNSGFLGVRMEDSDNGVVVKSVDSDTPAAKAGIKAGDIIVQVNEEEIDTTDSLLYVLSKTKPDQGVTIKALRDGKTLELNAKLGKRPPDLARGDFQNNMGSILSEHRTGFPVILQHDTVLKPYECGGPLVDLDGKTVGINIARGGRTETFAIPAETVQTLLADLMSGKLAPVVKAKPSAASRLKSAQEARAKAQSNLNEIKKQVDDSQKKKQDAERLLKDADDALKKAQTDLDAEKKKEEDKKKDESKKEEKKR